MFSLLLLLAPLVACTRVFIENDSANAGTILIPLMAGWDIVGISASFGSSSYVDALGGHSEILQTYNLLECIPLYGGASQMLVRTNETFQKWEDLYGRLTWEGGWSPFYQDTYTWDNVTYDDSMPGAVAMVNAVKKYSKTDNPVTIFAAGTLTTVAQAISIYPDLVKEAAGLYIMGGYLDSQYARATGPSIQDDFFSDINLYQDPEAAHLVLTSAWKDIYIGGNVTNAEKPSQEIYDRYIHRAGGMAKINSDPYYDVLKSEILHTGNYTKNTEQETLPFWDSVVSSYMVHPKIVTGETKAALSVDTAFGSPFYGWARIWSHDRKPVALPTGNVTIIDSINKSAFYDDIVNAFFQNYTQYCTTGKVVPL